MPDPVYWPVGNCWKPVSGTFKIESISTLSASPYTGSIKAIMIAELWVAEVTFDNRRLDDSLDFQTFLEELGGPATPVRLFDWWFRAPRLFSDANEPWLDGTFWDDGTGWDGLGFSPVIDVAATRGVSQVMMSGFPPNTPVLVRGDRFQIDIQTFPTVTPTLYRTSQPVTSDAAGKALVKFRPGLRGNIAAGDAVTLLESRGQFRMTEQVDTIIRMKQHSDVFTLKFAEDVI